jgi:hypothetical protein
MLYVTFLKCYQIQIVTFFNVTESHIYFLFFLLSHRFQPTKGERLIRLARRGMRTGQALFPLRIESGIPRVRTWKKLLVTGAQTTWFTKSHI